MDSQLSNHSDNFEEKVSYLLKHMYEAGGSDYKEFEFMPVRDYQIIHANSASEFEAILKFAEKNGWLEWNSRTPFSGGRVRYQGVRLTRSGSLSAEEKDSIVMLFDNAVTCPLTGLSIKGRVAFTALDGSQRALYTFAPIGQAIFERDHLVGLLRAIANGNQEPRLDLAGQCREAAERREPPLVITYQMFGKQQANTPATHEEKQLHLLRLLYETGGREHKKRDIFIGNDFPMAFAKNAQEFSEILESLLDEELLRYDKPNDNQNDWIDGVRTDYYGVLLTPTGKRKAKALIDNQSFPDAHEADSIKHIPSTNLANLHATVQQAAGSLLASAHYPQAILAACTALDKVVQNRAKLPATTVGTALMTTAFSAKNPLIQVSQDTNEQIGFMNLYQGSVQAIRNHYAHNLTEIPAARALEWLGFISALFYKLDEAQPIPASLVG
jgi:uncharacterized protein (TIGR02391 family)